VPSLLAPPKLVEQAKAEQRQARQALAPTHTERMLAWIAFDRGRLPALERAIPHEQPALLAYTPGR
jgi:hypothetical protein